MRNLIVGRTSKMKSETLHFRESGEREKNCFCQLKPNGKTVLSEIPVLMDTMEMKFSGVSSGQKSGTIHEALPRKVEPGHCPVVNAAFSHNGCNA